MSPLLVSFSSRQNPPKLYWKRLLSRVPKKRTPSWLSLNRKPRKSAWNGWIPIRRYETDLARLATLAKERGTVIVLFTDQWGSPISKIADHVVNAMVEVPSSWDSTLGVNLIVEALIAEVQTRRWDKARDRIEALEEMFRSTRLFRK